MYQLLGKLLIASRDTLIIHRNHAFSGSSDWKGIKGRTQTCLKGFSMPGWRPWEEYVRATPITSLIGIVGENTLTSIRTRASSSLGHLSSGLGGLSQKSFIPTAIIWTVHCDDLFVY